MKKKVVFVILILIILILCGVFIYKKTRKNEPIHTPAEFSTIMSSRNYIVEDCTYDFKDEEYFKRVFIAKSPNDSGCKIEFYQFTDNENAQNFYNSNKSIIESAKGKVHSKKSSKGSEYEKCILSTKDKYQVVSRVNDIVIYLDVDSSFEKEVNEVLKELGH